MARNVFFSFDFKRDAHRVSQVKNMGVIAGQPLLSSNQWEQVEKGGAKAIKAWIDKQMQGKSCLVVLIGRSTAGRRWVDYEIEKAWNDGRGVVGVYIHNLKDLSGKQSLKGTNPFSSLTVGAKKTKLSTIVKAYDPPYTLSTSVYNHIQKNLAAWVDEAIEIRNAYKQ
jgi:hypothetical protein